jgi:hypothetical protein
MVNECLLSIVAIATMLVPGLTSRERVVASRHQAGVLCRGISVQKKCGLVLRLRQVGPSQGKRPLCDVACVSEWDCVGYVGE